MTNISNMGDPGIHGNPHPSSRLRLGSVKGNIAHANCAAGATGLIKVESGGKCRDGDGDVFPVMW